jgi:small subunit ribosomal protein S16
VVKLRLRRAGKKKQPVYKIVAAHSQAARNGKYIEAIGQYDPLLNPIKLSVNEVRLFAWLKNGAQPSQTLRSLLQRQGLWMKWGLMRKGADEPTIAAEMEKWQSLQAEKFQREEAKKARRKAVRKSKAAASTDAAAAPAPAPAAEAPAAEAPAQPA